MKTNLLSIILLIFFSACKENDSTRVNQNLKPFTIVSVDTLLQEKISIRAILVDADKVWYAGTDGRYGFIDLKTDKRFSGHVTKDTLALEFRSIAKTESDIFLLNVGSPALLYRVSKDGSQIKKVYQENHPKAFYDSMQFWNDQEGIAMGDITENCLSVLITRDGGSSWNKISCEDLPKVQEGEAAFAASNTNIVIKGEKTWLFSGGTKSRVFYSSDKGKSWTVVETPIIQGKTMTGIFTADFYDEKNGFIAGGNYEKLDQKSGNKARTNDGGISWELVAENEGFGYASCVQYLPNSNGQELVTVGASGLYYSSNSGQNWKKLLDDTSLYTIRFVNDSTAIAAGKNKMIKVSFKY